MKALSIKQPWANMIMNGQKTIETRTWSTIYRGRLAIVSSRQPDLPNMLSGRLLCICELDDCRPMIELDEPAACCEFYEGAYAWVLSNIRKVVPVSIRGQMGLYQIDDDLIKLL